MKKSFWNVLVAVAFVHVAALAVQAATVSFQVVVDDSSLDMGQQTTVHIYGQVLDNPGFDAAATDLGFASLNLGVQFSNSYAIEYVSGSAIGDPDGVFWGTYGTPTVIPGGGGMENIVGIAASPPSSSVNFGLPLSSLNKAKYALGVSQMVEIARFDVRQLFAVETTELTLFANNTSVSPANWGSLFVAKPGTSSGTIKISALTADGARIDSSDTVLVTNASITGTPEPATLGILMLSGLGLLTRRRA